MPMFYVKGMNHRCPPESGNVLEEKVSWDHHSIIHFEFLNRYQTLIADLSS